VIERENRFSLQAEKSDKTFDFGTAASQQTTSQSEAVSCRGASLGKPPQEFTPRSVDCGHGVPVDAREGAREHRWKEGLVPERLSRRRARMRNTAIVTVEVPAIRWFDAGLGQGL